MGEISPSYDLNNLLFFNFKCFLIWYVIDKLNYSI